MSYTQPSRLGSKIADRQQSINSNKDDKFRSDLGENVFLRLHIINKLPVSVLSWQTPHGRLYNNPPPFDELRILGCLCYSHNPQSSKDKFGPKARRCVFIGFPPGQKAY